MGCHAAHALCLLFGRPNEVFACIESHSGAYPSCDDFGVARLRFADGILGTVEAAWTHVAAPGALEIFGSRAALWHDGNRYVMAAGNGAPEPIAPIAARATRIVRLIAVIRDELSPQELRAEFEAACDAVVVVSACYDSAASGTWVHVGGDPE